MGTWMKQMNESDQKQMNPMDQSNGQLDELNLNNMNEMDESDGFWSDSDPILNQMHESSESESDMNHMDE